MSTNEKYQPMTQRQRLENMTEKLGALTGKNLHAVRWNPGDGAKYSIECEGSHYSPWLPLGQLETLVEFALKVAYDTKN